MPHRRSPRSQWKTNALYSAIAAICANGLFVSQAQAVASCGPTVSADQGQCTPFALDDITVEPGVTISTTDAPAVLYYSDLGGYSEGEYLVGSLTNNGNILSSGLGEHFYSSSRVAGVAIDRELLGTLTNNGVISGSSESESGHSYAFGIIEGGAPFMQGTIHNSGTISASSTATDGYAEATGIYITQSVASDALIDNQATGEITATATGMYAAAKGVGAENFSGMLENDGVISAHANSNGYMGAAFGIYAQTFSGVVNNRGTISAANTDGGEGLVAGFYNESMWGGEINNYGTIAGTAGAGSEAYSILNTDSEGSGTINNMLGGVLRGTLQVYGYGANVSNAGLIDLSDSAVQSYVAGDFTQSDTGTLRIMAAGEDQYSQLRVGGNATIAGDAFVDVQEINTLAVGQTLYGVVYTNYDGYLSGNFAQVNDNSALFNFQSLSTEGEDGYIDFKIVKAMTAVDAVNANNNPGALGAAGALDGVIDRGATNPNMQTVIDALGKLGTEQDVSDAASQTTPLLVGNSAIAANAALAGINRVIQSRIESRRGMSSGDELYGNQRVWLKTFGSHADQNDRNGTSGFEADTAGLALGADGTVSDNTRIGVAFAYANADIDGNSSTAPNSAEVDVFQLLGYGSHSLDANTELNFQAGIGQNNTEGKRDILFLGETARSDYDSLVATAGVGLARTYTLNESTDFTPSVRTDYTWIRDDSYTETGSSANLQVDSRTTDQLILSVDGTLSHEFKPDMVVSANLGLGYDALNSQSSITASFAGEPGTGFTTDGLDPSPWLQRAGLGLVTNTENGMEISLRYDAEHRESFLNQTASLKLRMEF